MSSTAKKQAQAARSEVETCHEAAGFLTLAAGLLAKVGWSYPGTQGPENGPRSIENAVATMVRSTDFLLGEPQDNAAAFEQAIDALWMVSSASGSRSLEAWQRTPGRTARDVQQLLEQAIDMLATGRAPAPPNEVIKSVLGQAAYLIEREGHCKGRQERMHADGEGKQRSVMCAVWDAAVQVARSDDERCPTTSLPKDLYASALEQLDRALPWHWRERLAEWNDAQHPGDLSVHRVLAGAQESCGQAYVWTNYHEQCWASYPGDKEASILTVRQLSVRSWMWSLTRVADGNALQSGTEASRHAAQTRAEHAHADLNPIGGAR